VQQNRQTKITKRTIHISSLVACSVFILGNVSLTISMSNKASQIMSAYINIKLTVPNGYISKSVEMFGFKSRKAPFLISKRK